MTALALCLGASRLLAQTPATVTAAPISDVTGDSGWFMIGRTVNDNIPGDINGVGLGISIDDAPGNAYALTFGVNPPYPAEAIAERMRITSTGNVGIGTAKPTAPLDVAGPALGTAAGNTVPLFTLQNANGNENYLNIFQIRNSGGTNWTSATTRIQQVTDATPQAYMDFNPAGGQYGMAFGSSSGPAPGEYMRIVNGGNVGIGTAAPAYPLDVAGAIRSSGAIYASGGIVFPDGSTQASALNSGGQTLTTANSAYGDINVTINAANVPVINFTRWTGNGSTQDNAYAGLFYNPADKNFDFGIGTGISTTGSQTATATVLDVNRSGNVGIGTLAPAYTLDVAGAIHSSAGGVVFPDGTTQTTAFLPANCGADYAESVGVSGDRTAYGPGDVLVIDPDKPGSFLRSAQPYSTMVAGIYSTQPGFVGRLHPADAETGKTEVPMAMVGRVPTKVSAENGPIKVGDLLVTSSTLGYAMKATDRSQMLGAVVGKALAPLDSGTGVILVLVTLQ